MPEETSDSQALPAAPEQGGDQLASKATSEPKADSGDSGGSGRRDFLTKAACVVGGAVLVAVPLGAGLGSLLAPLRKKAGSTGLKVRLAAVDDLPADGTPRVYKVVDKPTDAWIKYPTKPIGEVLLRRMPDGSVLALNSTCPHAGCGVSYRSGERDLYCPCHASNFALDGERLGDDNKSPRSLDTLDVDPEMLATGEIWVTFLNFRIGVEDKEAIS